MRYARATVADLDHSLGIFEPCGDADVCATMIDGVLDQIGQGLLEQVYIQFDHGARLQVCGQLAASLFHEGAVDVGDIAGQGGDILRLCMQNGIPAFDTGQCQQGLEQGADLIGFLDGFFDGIVTGLGIVDVGGQNLQPVANAVQRSAQFMGDTF